MADNTNYTTINDLDVREYNLDPSLKGKTVTAAEYKKLTGMDKVKPAAEETASVTDGNKGVAETTADQADEPAKKSKKKSK